MRLLPDAKHGRFLAVVILFIALLLAYMLGLHWWFIAPHAQLRSDLIELRDQEFEFRSTSQQRPKVEERLAEARRFEAENPGFLNEANFDLAAAALIQRLENLIGERASSRERCAVVSRTPFRPRDAEPFQRVTIKVRMRCEMEDFVEVLHGLEGGSPMLLVEQLSVSRRGVQTTRGQGRGQSYLDISFDLSGYLRLKGAG